MPENRMNLLWLRKVPSHDMDGEELKALAEMVPGKYLPAGGISHMSKRHMIVGISQARAAFFVEARGRKADAAARMAKPLTAAEINTWLASLPDAPEG